MAGAYFTTTDPNPQTRCPLIKIASELRNYIYTLVLSVRPNERRTILITKTPNHPEVPTVLTLLQTCRLIRNEAQGLFYSIQRLELRARDNIPEWGDLELIPLCGDMTRRLCGQGRSAICDLSITYICPQRFSGALRVLHRLEGLETLTLNLSGSYTHYRYVGSLRSWSKSGHFGRLLSASCHGA